MYQVKQHAAEWEKRANIKFDWVASGEADIRISFSVDKSCWSYIGTGSKHISDCQASMNMSIPDETDPVTTRVIVLHELGHAIGFVHSFPPTITDAVWDKPKLYAYYAEKLKWTNVAVDRRILRKTSLEDTKYWGFDENSIMQYWLPTPFTSGFMLSLNTKMSKRDILMANEVYPHHYAVGSVDLSVAILPTYQGSRKTYTALSEIDSPMTSATFIGLNKLRSTNIGRILCGWVRTVVQRHDKPSPSIKAESSLWGNKNITMDPLVIGASWLRLDNTAFSSVQYGTFCTSTMLSCQRFITDCQHGFHTVITLKQSFHTPPTIFVGFTGIDIFPYLQVQVFASKITTRNFTLTIVQTTPNDRQLNGPEVQWIAIASDDLCLSAGKFVGSAKEGFKGKVELDRPMKNPKVFTAISKIVTKSADTDIQLTTSNIESQQLRWEFTGNRWDTEVEANYLVIDL